MPRGKEEMSLLSIAGPQKRSGLRSVGDFIGWVFCFLAILCMAPVGIILSKATKK